MVLDLPSAIFAPKFMQTMWGQIVMTSSMWCSMTRIVSSKSLWMPRISSLSCSTSSGFMPAAGSSSRSRSGLSDRARAISRRRCRP